MVGNSRAWLLGTASYIAVALVVPRCGLAEVRTDGTLGARVRLQGGDIAVDADLGQQRGSNLFHSFEKFDVETTGKVTFTGPDSVKNVIGRVTGGEPSSIDGTLASSIPDADLYLLNPAGILFGPNARLDVKGSFHASTASELRLSDGAVFSALDTASSSLSVAEPQSFGFLGAPPGAITVAGSVLQVAAGKHLSLTAGDVALSGGALLAGDPEPRDGVAASGGQITLAGLHIGAVDLVAAWTVGAVGGSVTVGGQAKIDVSGDGGGAIRIRAEDVTLRGQSQILASNLGNDGGSDGIDLAGGRLALTEGSVVAADTGLASVRLPDGSVMPTVAAGGTGGGLNVDMSTDVRISQGSQLRAATYGFGDAGSVAVVAPLLVIDGSGFGSVTGIRGVSGIDPGAPIRPSAAPATGNAGNVVVRVGNLELRGGGSIAATTFGTGASGRVDIVALNQLRIDGAGAAPYVGQFRPTQIGVSSLRNASGGPGDLRIVTGDLEIVNNGTQPAEIRGVTSGSAAGTPVYIRASSVVIDGSSTLGAYEPGPFTGIVGGTRQFSGDAAAITMIVDRGITLRNGGQIFGLTEGSGRGSSIYVRAHDLTLEGLGSYARSRTQIISSSGGRGARGDGGSINVAVQGRLQLRNGARIVTSTEDQGIGDAGRIAIVAGGIDMSGASAISARTSTSGNTGNVLIYTDGPLSMAGELTRISTDARSAGSGGAVEIVAGAIDLRDGAFITSNADGDGDGGSISIATRSAQLSRGASIDTSASGSGSAGSVSMVIAEELGVDGASISSNSSGVGGGGAINIRAPSADARIQGFGQISASARGGGTPGSIAITVRELTGKDGSIATASRGTAGGKIDIAASDRIYLRNSSVNSSGIVPEGSSGIIRLIAPTVVLNETQVVSLTATGAVLPVEPTILSDTQVDIGSELRLNEDSFIQADRLMQPSCADRGAARSSFARGGRGGLAPAPDRSLPSTGAMLSVNAPHSETMEPMFLDVCAGTLVSGRES